MRPVRDGGLVDLLDIALNKGILLKADIIITVAEVPLIGICLRAAIASIETMLDYGVFQEDDPMIRGLNIKNI